MVPLWFDVGIKRYTTFVPSEWYSIELWFDVGIKRYTTSIVHSGNANSCGLM